MIKPRAYKCDRDYYVQPHFYHETDGCREETYIHYICKNWLFEKGCKFIVDECEYIVDHIEIEKTLHTSFGDYKPDIIVTTTNNSIFYFEIKTTNKKTELLTPKWDELGNKVVEVDTRYFINQKYKNNIPEFNLIYSDGECFIKSYSRIDYDNTIAKRKLDWKRQDKLNYKVQWERLDWFWIKLQKYTSKEIAEEDVLNFFDELDYSDKLWCYYTIMKKSCVRLKELFKDNINQHFLEILNSYKDDKITISFKQISPKIYKVKCRVEFSYLDYTLFEQEVIKVKVQKGDILPLDYEKVIKESISSLQEQIQKCESLLKKIEHISELPYVKNIVPYSHWASEKYNFHSLLFNVELEEYIHNKSIKEVIGKICIMACQLSEWFIKEEYVRYKNDALNNLENELIKYALKKNELYQNVIHELKVICKNTDYLQINKSDDNRRMTLVNGHTCIFEYEYNKHNLFGTFEKEVRQKFITHIEEQMEQHTKISSYVNLINSCKNKLWKITDFTGNDVTLCLVDPNTNKELKHKCFSLYNCNDIKSEIFNTMKDLLKYVENYNGIRFMGER